MPDVIYAQQHPSADPTDVDAYTFKFEGATKYIRAEIAEELAEYLRLSLHGNEDAEWFNDAYEALQKYEKMMEKK